ncbi:Rieske [2Fe-2S] iron-sulfur domain-containing protein [Aspergillus egyptiacus]|nr:Rieske [2Fe-2S] iron-sulfur domain-containing protein [Aspergillus egyptiacus]
MESLVLSFLALAAAIVAFSLLYRLLSRNPTLSQPPPTKINNPSTPTGYTDITTVTKESPLPNDWLTSKPTFSLECRAIFSKTWIPLTHKTRLPTPGTYQTFTLASFPILLITGKDNAIRAFHNVCRHRAYPVTRKESGCSAVLRCRYHGWSYNSQGELIRAPHFDGVEGFERGVNGLFEIRVWVLRKNLFENLVPKSALEDRTPLSLLQYILPWTRTCSQQAPDTLRIFPTAYLYTIPSAGCWVFVNFLPSSESRTSIRYDLYSYGNLTEQLSRDLTVDLKNRVRNLVTKLETEYRGYTTAGGSLRDVPYTSTVQYTETQTQIETETHILTLLKEHTKAEKTFGREIHPARREPRMDTKYERAEQREAPF